jgi:branched-chain amino acid transport system permease protein
MHEFLIYLVIGLTVGGIYAITATGLVMTYTTSRIFNFAQGSMGMLVAFVYYQLRVVWNLPSLVALVLSVLVVAPLLGATLDLVLFSRIQRAPLALKLVATLALSLALQGVAQLIWGTSLRSMPPIFSSDTFTPVSGVNITYDQLATVVAALIVAVLLWYLFRRTRLGTTMRAVVDDPTLAELHGVSPVRITALSWAMGSALAGLATILVAPRVTLSIQALSGLVVTAFAAAIIGRLSSMAFTFAGGIALGLISSFMTGYLPPTNELLTDLTSAMPFVVLFVALLVLREERGAAARTISFPEPAPPRMRTTLLLTLAAFVVALIVSPALSDFQSLVVGVALTYASILLSLVLITGMSGQVSLAQFSFAGLGAILLAHLDGHMPYVLALICAVLITAIVGGLVALPALRLRGLYLALATLAFAFLMDGVVFPNSHVIPISTQTVVVPLPSAFGLSVKSGQAFVPFLTLFVGLCAVAILAVRRSRVGRSLSAMRDAPLAASALGLGLVRTKVLVFAASAGLAGLGGSFYGAAQHQVGASDFVYLLSLSALLILAIQGLTSVTGAIVGAGFYAIAFLLLPQWIDNADTVSALQPLLIGLGVLNLALFPAGAVAQQRAQFEHIRKRLARTTRTDAVPDDEHPAASFPVPQGVGSSRGGH